MLRAISLSLLREKIKKKINTKLCNNAVKEAYLPASTTVEASLVVPIFVYAAVAVMYMIQVVAVRARVNEALYDTLRKSARYAYVYDSLKGLSGDDSGNAKNKITADENNPAQLSGMLSSGLSIAAFQQLFISELGEDFAKNNNIVGGNPGWNFAQSKVLNNNSLLDIKLTYYIKNPFDVFGVAIIKVSEVKRTNAWLGEDSDSFTYNTSQVVDKDIYVYITSGGSVYHTKKTCTYLTRNLKTSNVSETGSLRNNSGGKYYPCTICKADTATGEVYYTDYGDRYHKTAICTKLSRDILTVKKSSVPERRECEKCKAEAGGS